MAQSPFQFDDATIQDARQLIRLAIREDLEAYCDCTSAATIPEQAVGSAHFVSRQAGVVCGLEVARLIVADHAAELDFEKLVEDGEAVEPQQPLARIAGAARTILAYERICLNFMGRLSGVASLTAKFVGRAEGTRARIFDTRKTTPGFRRLEKYAVACGGGANHRLGLFDAFLIKDNHIAMCGALAGDRKRSISEMLKLANDWKADNIKRLPNGQATIIQIEVDSLEQLEEALSNKNLVDIVLLDNMKPDRLKAAVEIRDRIAPEVELEASGGVNLDTVAAIAQTGVDRISVGALTHSAVNFDIGLDWSG